MVTTVTLQGVNYLDTLDGTFGCQACVSNRITRLSACSWFGLRVRSMHFELDNSRSRMGLNILEEARQQKFCTNICPYSPNLALAVGPSHLSALSPENLATNHCKWHKPGQAATYHPHSRLPKIPGKLQNKRIAQLGPASQATEERSAGTRSDHPPSRLPQIR